MSAPLPARSRVRDSSWDDCQALYKAPDKHAGSAKRVLVCAGVSGSGWPACEGWRVFLPNATIINRVASVNSEPSVYCAAGERYDDSYVKGEEFQRYVASLAHGKILPGARYIFCPKQGDPPDQLSAEIRRAEIAARPTPDWNS